MKDRWLEEHLENPEVRVRLGVCILLIQILAILSIFIGGIMLLLYVLGII